MRKITLLLSMLLLSVLAFAQTARTGTVRDEKGNPIPFATITEVGKNNVVQADANGAFSIRALEGAQLRITASGHQPQNVTVAGNTVAATLAVVNEQLSEVIVTTALGVQRQAKELGYSTARVRSAELNQAAPINLQNGLTGKVSGLNINTANNGVFADTRITIRGIRSLTGNNQPMLVIDGVPAALGFLNSINPNDVADVTVLKSSSATVIYGPDGVNGAIVVTTKRGVRGRPLVTVSHTAQMEKLAYFPKIQKRFGSGYSPDAGGFGTYEPIEQQSWGPEFNGEIVQIGQDGPNGEKIMVPYSFNENGRTGFFNTGITNQTDLSYSNDGFYISAQNVSIKGIMPDDQNNRRSFTLRSEREYGRFKAGFNLRYTNSEYDVTTQGRIIYYGVTGAPGQIDLSQFEDVNSHFGSPNGYFTPYLDNNVKTPYFGVKNWREKGNGDDIFGNVELGFKATSWLDFVYRAGITYSNDDARSTRGAWQYSAYHKTLRDAGSTNLTSAVTQSSNEGQRITSEVFANFKKSFKRFGLNGTIGQSYRQTTSRFLSVGSNNLGNSTLFSVAVRKGEPTVGVANSKVRLGRYFGRVGFSFDDWAFVEATGSYDRDSRLVNPLNNTNESSFFYPGVNASFVLSQAIPQLKNSATISFLKLRGAISKTGNVNLGAYAFESVFSSSTFFPYGDILGFQATANTPAATYKPEFVLNREVGLEVGFLKNRINVEATYYNQDNTDQIINVQLSNTTGYTSALQNAASFVNKGLELDLRLTPLVDIGDVKINFKANYAYQTNEVTSLVDGVNELGIGNSNFIIVGESAYKFKLTDYIRDAQGRVIVDRTTGMPDQNPNLTVFGNTLPTHILGLNLDVDWKGLSLSAVGEYRGGNQMLAEDLGNFLDDNGISERSAQNGRRAFVFPNSVYDDGSGKYVENKDVYTQTYGRLFWNSALNTNVQTNYLASAAFWKLREVSLTYTIPTKIFGSGFEKIVKGATIGVNGRNLIAWLPKSNVWTDPEFSTGTGNATGVSSASQLPPTRIFGANLTVRF
ncbi:MAG: SusC/RagA family TonB-linked outer membrane protein [Flavisolibacter sp.]|jgi:TonB-linked SusC/RagA family outer membrane protein|nr:SusC/RagA family TonB-linked outer membrane protein [Flavisolibacter sp.]